MANEASVMKIPQDIEYKAIGNAFGLLIASGGLLAGAMVTERSLAYWPQDIVPLGLCVFMGWRLFRNVVATLTLYSDAPHLPSRAPQRENVASEAVPMPQIPQVPGFTPDQVVEEVVKRIEAQKADQARKADKGKAKS